MAAGQVIRSERTGGWGHSSNASINELREWMAGGRGKVVLGSQQDREGQDPNPVWVTLQKHECCQEGTWFCVFTGTKDLSAFLIDLRLKAEEKGVGIRDEAATEPSCTPSHQEGRTRSHVEPESGSCAV